MPEAVEAAGLIEPGGNLILPGGISMPGIEVDLKGARLQP